VEDISTYDEFSKIQKCSSSFFSIDSQGNHIWHLFDLIDRHDSFHGCPDIFLEDVGDFPSRWHSWVGVYCNLSSPVTYHVGGADTRLLTYVSSLVTILCCYTISQAQ
jgi:hypothetical protein